MPSAMLRGQLLLIGIVAVLHASITWAPKGTFHPLITTLFDVDHEMNLPTWFSSAQWLMLFLTLISIAVLVRVTERSRGRSALWGISALIALILSIDETAVVHERIGTILEEALEQSPRGSGLHSMIGLHGYYWIVAYLPFVIPTVVVGAVFLWRELGPQRWTVFVGIFTFLYAAIGLDFIEGRFGTPDHTGLPLHIASRVIMVDIFLVEETLEMLGVCLVQYALLRHLSGLASRGLVLTRPNEARADRSEAYAHPVESFGLVTDPSEPAPVRRTTMPIDPHTRDDEADRDAKAAGWSVDAGVLEAKP